jgi:HSP20 family protein
MSLPTRVRHDPFEVAQRDFDTFFGRLLAGNGAATHFAPFGVDVREVGDNLIVEAELPGFTKEQVDLTLENGLLTITAERNEEPAKPEAGNYLIKERRYTRFQRSFSLPPTIDPNTVDAKLENGVLSVTLTKRQEAKPRKIAVS